MKQNEENADPAPACGHSLEIPGNLFAQVARPDDQKLREAEVCPQHHEREQELSEVVKTVRVENPGEFSFSRQQNTDGDRECKACEAVLCNEQEAPHSGVPVWLQ